MSGTAIVFYYQNSGSHSLVLLQQLAVPRGDKRAAPHAYMQTVIGSLIIATKAVHFGEFLAELDSQLSLAYKRKLFKSRKLNLYALSTILSSHNRRDDTYQHHKRTPQRS